MFAVGEGSKAEIFKYNRTVVVSPQKSGLPIVPIELF